MINTFSSSNANIDPGQALGPTAKGINEY